MIRYKFTASSSSYYYYIFTFIHHHGSKHKQTNKVCKKTHIYESKCRCEVPHALAGYRFSLLRPRRKLQTDFGINGTRLARDLPGLFQDIQNVFRDSLMAQQRLNIKANSSYLLIHCDIVKSSSRSSLSFYE